MIPDDHSLIFQPNYNWDKMWTVPYESLWSLLHKFAVLNHVCLSEAKTVFESNCNHNYQREASALRAKTRINKWNLHILSGFDAEKLCKTLNLSPLDLNQSLAYNFIPESEIYCLTPKNTLRYCPKCIARGYHSVFHQLYAIQTCPIDQSKLIDKCQQCGSTITYSIEEEGQAFPYSCQVCGTRLWKPYIQSGGFLEPNILKLDSIQKARLDHLNIWFRTALNSLIQFPNMDWTELPQAIETKYSKGQKKSIAVRKKLIPSYWNDVIGNTLPSSMCRYNRKDTIHSMVKYHAMNCITSSESFKYHYSNMQLRTKDGNNLACINISSDIIRIYKSIRRYLAKTFLRDTHKKCAYLLDKSFIWRLKWETYSPICPFGFAFVLWKKYWERGVRSSSYKKIISWKSPSYFNLSNNPFENKLISLRIFALECYWSFQECVLITKSMRRSNHFIWDRKVVKGKTLNYWVVEHSMNKHYYTLHWWTRKSICKIFLKDYEPNKSHHQRKTSKQLGRMTCMKFSRKAS